MASKKPQFEATWFEKVTVPVTLLSVLTYGLYMAVVAPFRGPSGASTYKSHIGHAMVRKLIGSLSVPQLHYIGDFIGLYKKWCDKNGQAADIVTLSSGVKVFWMGKRDADYVCLYFHGGGYNMDGDDGHLNYWNRVQKEIATTGKSMSMLYVAYSLAPVATYPSQLQECVEALQYLLDECHRKPSDILLAGDSAGGNMSLAVLSHLSHPAPSVAEVKLAEPLKAAILVSPWVSFSDQWGSFATNEFKDIIATKGAGHWSANYMGSRPSDNYTEPLNADVKWWEGVKVEQVLCVAGADELLIDSINAFMKIYTAANPKTTTYVVAKNEVHIQPILYSAYNSNKTDQGVAIESFLKKIL